MYECQYPNLFKPLKLGNTILRNRIFAASYRLLHLTVGEYRDRAPDGILREQGARRLRCAKIKV